VSPVAISADRRFHRAHVRPARKRGRLRNLAWPVVKYGVVAALVSLAIYRGQAVLADSALLQIDRIIVSGNHRMASGDVLATLGGLRGENILWSDLDGWRDRLLASPWVREATFRRSLPSTVEVLVSEREPIGIARLKGQLFLVDDRGSAIDVYGPQYADFDLPIIDGLTASNRAAIGVDSERGELAARVILSLRAKPSLARRLSQVDVTDQHNAAVILNGDQAVIYVGQDRFLPRIESYLELSAALRERVPDVDYVDLRFDDRIYVRPTGKRGKAGPSVRDGPVRPASVEQTRSGPRGARR
jgi:cell division protein FtsQ